MIQLKSSIAGDSTEAPLFIDCTAISWDAERKVDYVYGLGGQPRKRGFGNVTYEASMTIPFGTQMMLREKSTDGTLLGLGEFNLIISWANDLSETIVNETVTLMGCILTGGGLDANQDDTSLPRKFDLHPYRIYTPKVANSATGWSHEMYSK